jgi:hypothetical protein
MMVNYTNLRKVAGVFNTATEWANYHEHGQTIRAAYAEYFSDRW